MKIPFTGETYLSRSRDVNYQQCINWYPETDPTGRNRVVLYPTPGKVVFSQVGLGPIRGMHEFNDKLYVVSGNEVFEVTTSGAGTLLGTMSTSTSVVGMADNGTVGNQLIIVDGTGTAYIYNISTTTFSSQALPDSPSATATHVEFVDGYFLINDTSRSGRFYRSESYDGTSWNALWFATAERSPDDLKAIISSHRNVYMIGKDTTELWYNSGTNTIMPFEPIPGAMMELGIVAPYSVAKHGNQTIWLASDKRGHGQIITAQGPSHQVISNYSIETSINSYSDITDARGWTYQQEGHTFYVITFPTGNETWVYDFTEQKWHQRQSYDSGSNNRDRGQWISYFSSKILTGDRENGKIYQLDLNTYTEDGSNIRHIRSTQPIHSDDGNNLFYRAVYLKFEGGVGDVTTPNPQVKISWSDDGGHTFTSQITRTLSNTYGERVTFRRLKPAESRIFEVECSDPVKYILIAGYADIVNDSSNL